MGDTNFTTQDYEQFLTQGKLMGSKCKNCGTLWLPLKPICGRCHQGNMELAEMKGKGRLVAYSVITVGTQMMIEEGFDKQHPYCSGIVELEEGVKIPGRIVGVDVENPEKITIGTPVTVEFVKRENKPTVLSFKV